MRLQELRAICNAVTIGAVILFAGVAIGASRCTTADARPALNLTVPATPSPPPFWFQLDDTTTGKPMHWRTADGRAWCPTPVTSLAWTVCP